MRHAQLYWLRMQADKAVAMTEDLDDVAVWIDGVARLIDRHRPAIGSEFLVEYLALVNAYSMKPTVANDPDGRLIVAAKFRGVRLIDNIGIREDIH